MSFLSVFSNLYTSATEETVLLCGLEWSGKSTLMHALSRAPSARGQGRYRRPDATAVVPTIACEDRLVVGGFSWFQMDLGGQTNSRMRSFQKAVIWYAECATTLRSLMESLREEGQHKGNEEKLVFAILATKQDAQGAASPGQIRRLLVTGNAEHVAWSPALHHTFDARFRSTAMTLMMCNRRRRFGLPRDVLWLIIGHLSASGDHYRQPGSRFCISGDSIPPVFGIACLAGECAGLAQAIRWMRDERYRRHGSWFSLVRKILFG